MNDRSIIFQSIAQFINKEINLGIHSSEVNESLEIAKQCIETAFPSLNNDRGKIPDFESLFNQSSQKKNSEAGPEANLMAETLKNQGNSCMQQEKFEEAIACYTKSIELSPNNAVYYCNRAAAYSRLEQHEDAIFDCKKALEIDPQYGKAYGRMGIAYSSLGNYARAIDCYKKGLELEPDNANYKQNLSIAEGKLNAPPESSQPFGSFGGIDLCGMMNNPVMQNMARQFMSDPNAKDLVTNLIRNTLGVSTENPSATTEPSEQNTNGESNTPSNMDEFLRFGQQLAEQMRSANPQFINNLQNTFNQTEANRRNNNERSDDQSFS